MRVALVCPYAWDFPGGVQGHVRELAARLRAGGDDVLVLAPGSHPAPESFVVIIGHPVPIGYNASKVPIDPRPWSRREIGRRLRAFVPDVVHVHEPFSPSTSLWALLETRAPVVATFHSSADRSLLLDAAAPVLRLLARRITVRIAVSQAAKTFAASRIPGSFDVIANGIDIERFAGAEPAALPAGPTLLFVGRLEERKGFPVAVEAFRRLASDRPDLRMVVAGDGKERTAIGRLDAGQRARILLLGSVSNERLPGYHAAADVYLGPALGGESFGIVLVEAMAAGLPVVASRIAGYVEVVRDGVDGLLVPPGDPGALAASTARILGDPALAARLSQAGRDRAAEFEWSIVAAAIRERYEWAIETGASPLR
ncbi:MAG: glycosyltransferase family 4 protein [Actinomycetota bacterium]